MSPHITILMLMVGLAVLTWRCFCGRRQREERDFRLVTTMNECDYSAATQTIKSR